MTTVSFDFPCPQALTGSHQCLPLNMKNLLNNFLRPFIRNYLRSVGFFGRPETYPGWPWKQEEKL